MAGKKYCDGASNTATTAGRPRGGSRGVHLVKPGNCPARLQKMGHFPWRCNPLRFWEPGLRGGLGEEGAGERRGGFWRCRKIPSGLIKKINRRVK